jgi:hypothetical protein
VVKGKPDIFGTTSYSVFAVVISCIHQNSQVQQGILFFSVLPVDTSAEIPRIYKGVAGP